MFSLCFPILFDYRLTPSLSIAGTKPSDFNFDNGDSRDNVNIKVKDSGAATINTNAVLALSLLLVALLSPTRLTRL